MRQWVLSLPLEIRYRLAYDGSLLSDVLGVFLRVVRRWYQERGRELGLADCRRGSVTFAQRFGSALNLNPHFHSLALDGVFNARIDDDRLSFRLKTPWADGTTHLILSPLELIEKLAALVPPPRVNLVRYHGVLAAHARDRDKIVPKKPAAEKLREERGASRNRLLWAALLARVFAIDVTKCPKCNGRLRLVAAITDTASAKRYLDGVGLPSEIPSLAPARAPPQLDFDW